MAVNAGQWAYLVMNLVVAYEAGGAAATGLLGVASFIAPTVVSPFAGIPAARWRPERVLATVTSLRVLAVALTVGLIGSLAGARRAIVVDPASAFGGP